MADEYTLLLDFPYTELDEPGWARERLMRDVLAEKMVDHSSGLFFERLSGTLMLMPHQADPVARYQDTAIGAQLDSTSIMTAPGQWEETVMPDGTIMHRSMLGPSTLIEALILAGVDAVTLAMGRVMKPVIKTVDDFAVNEGLYVGLEVYGQQGKYSRDWIGILFGDFLLTLHTNGTADLFWSQDGSGSSESWVRRKSLNSIPPASLHGVAASLAGVPVATSQRPEVLILPFGQGNILIHSSANGKTYSAVYTHPEAEYSTAEDRYRITRAGPVVILVNENDAKNLGVSLSKLTFPTGVHYWTDSPFELPYCPTLYPSATPVWSKTMGSPTVTAEVVTPGGDTWLPTGTVNACALKLGLSGDGTNSPFVNGFHLYWERTTKIYNPTEFTIPQNKILSLEFSDGEDFDDQRCSVTIFDDGSDDNVRALIKRSEVNGKLMRGSQCLGIFTFRQPRCVYGKAFNEITLAGENFGVSRVARKRWLFPRTYGGAAPEDVVRDSLMKCGFPSEDIIADASAEGVKLPETSLTGQGTDKGASEIKSQPQFNSPVDEWLLWIRDNFTPYPHWRLWYDTEGKWHFQAIETPTDALGTIKSAPSHADIVGGAEWYAVGLESELEPPEANDLLIFGVTDTNDVISDGKRDPDSIDYPGTPKPLNYLGRVERVTIIDKALNSFEAIDAVLDRVFPTVSEAIWWFTWKGPFRPAMAVNTAWRIDGVGLLQIKSFEAAAKSLAELEKTASTTYVAKWIGD